MGLGSGSLEELVMVRSFSPLPDPQFWQGRRVLLTGHTGFKGSWLALWLLQLGAEVHGFSLAPDTEPSLWQQLNLVSDQVVSGPGLLRHRLGDVRDAELLAAVVGEVRPEVVLHLAAQPLVRRSYADPLGTWSTNVLGTLHLLEALRCLEHPCAAVMITTDKVYRNQEWQHSYRESDPLGGHDPYSSSKAAAELAIASWRNSFCGPSPHQTPWLALASVRAGNVIGGGDWSEDRLVPDLIRSLLAGVPLPLRSPGSTRPWQHVLEPVCAYLLLAEQLFLHHDPGSSLRNPYADAFNIGPSLASNRSVGELVSLSRRFWPLAEVHGSSPMAADLHEASLLNLCSDLAYHRLGWQPRWDFEVTVQRTMDWYRRQQLEGEAALSLCQEQIAAFTGSSL